MAEPISIVLTGDVMLGRGVDEAIRRFGVFYPWGNVISHLKAADVAIVNLECVIARGGRPWERWSKEFHFRADPVAIATLRLAGVDGVTLANNHVLDYEEEALLEMLDLLKQRGISYAGAGRNLEEARTPALLRAPDLQVGLVAFTDNEPGWRATATSPGINWIDITLDESSLKPVREAIDRARTMGADLVLFSIHWGPNMVERPSKGFRDFAHAVMDAGADVFHGHSAHLFQGIEIYKGKPIIYDAGDFVDDYAVDPLLRNDRGLLFRLLVEEKKLRQIQLIPTSICYCQVNLATEEPQKAIVERIRSLSAEMGTVLDCESDPQVPRFCL